MSEPVRIALFGSTGLVGSQIIREAVGRADLRLTAVARREFGLPAGAHMELIVAGSDAWTDILRTMRPDVVVSTLGTTWKKAERDEEAFRAVDHDLVMEVARAARETGATRFVAVSSVGADYNAKTFYLRVKGETDRDLSHLQFKRLDILRPGLLRGKRDNDLRVLEGLGRLASPVVDLFLQGGAAKARSIPAATVARACLSLAKRKASGRFVHDNDAIRRAAGELGELAA